jgi:hypothetical protein
MAQITYDDKVTSNPQPGIPEINKVTGDNMTEIKTVVNGNDTTTAAHIGNTSNPHSVDFKGLTDTPVNYTGQAGKVVAVKGTEDGVDFATISNGVIFVASKIAVITSSDWLVGGTSGFYYDFVHGLNSETLLFQAYDTDTGNAVEDINELIPQGVNTTRFESSVGGINRTIILDNGGQSILMPESTVDEVNAITFLNTNGAYFGKFASARTGTLTFDTTDAVTGAISVVYYNNPTLDIPVTPIFTSGTFVPSVVNKLYFERDEDNNYTLNIIN